MVNEPSVFEPLKFNCSWLLSVGPVFLGSVGALPCSFAIFTMENNFPDFLFASLVNKALLKWDLPLKKRIYFWQSEFSSFRFELSCKCKGGRGGRKW